MIDLRPPWQEIEASIAHLFAKKVRAGQTLEDVDLFGPALTALRAPPMPLAPDCPLA